MRQTFLLLFSLAASRITAAPIACANQTFDKYSDLKADGCLIGDKRFFEFLLEQRVPGTGPNSNQISVEVLGANTLNPGFLFKSDLWDTDKLKNRFSSIIRFSIEVRPNGAAIKDASLKAKATSFEAAGFAHLIETLCLGTFAIECDDPVPKAQLEAKLSKQNLEVSDSDQFAPTRKVSVDLRLSGDRVQPVDRAARINEVSVRFSEVPEPNPGGLVLLVGVLSLALHRKGSACQHRANTTATC